MPLASADATMGAVALHVIPMVLPAPSAPASVGQQSQQHTSGGTISTGAGATLALPRNSNTHDTHVGGACLFECQHAVSSHTYAAARRLCA